MELGLIERESPNSLFSRHLEKLSAHPRKLWTNWLNTRHTSQITERAFYGFETKVNILIFGD